MNDLLLAMFPEIVLCIAALLLMLMGVSMKASTRRAAPVVAILALLIAGVSQLSKIAGSAPRADLRWNTVHIYEFARYIKLLSSAIGILLVLLAWPSNRDATGGPAHHFGAEAGEFFGLMLLAIAGIFIVAGANDIMLLFLGIELASIPTYIMVSISAPRATAQEAGVKYFFLGAMAAAIMLFGFSYLFGTTGTTRLDLIAEHMGAQSVLSTWQILAVVLLIAGFAFKMAVVPLHFYAGDVYQGAATPVTAFLSFVPKISGFVALLKVLFAVTGGTWHIAPEIVKLLWILAALTMTVGNVLGLVQVNIKRLFAYSSIAHSGYMLVGVTALISTADYEIQSTALQGILFYLTAYGLMNVAVFGVLLPSRLNQPAMSAETFDDIAGSGKEHTLLGLAMAVSCFSLIGLPLTVGFFGKFYLILPAWKANLTWLVIILVINAAISAGYYLRIVSAIFLGVESTGPRYRQQPASTGTGPIHRPVPVLVAVGISMVAILWLGTVWPATTRLLTRTATAAHIEPATSSPLAER
jgi:NADH-quinone oxidoreductase subunit N